MAGVGVSGISQGWWVLFAFVLAAAFVVALIRPARRAGLVDHPAGRKKHEAPTVLVGGVAIFLSVLLTTVSCRLARGSECQPVDRDADRDRHRSGGRCARDRLSLEVLRPVDRGAADRFRHIRYTSCTSATFSGWAIFRWTSGLISITVIAIIGLMNAINMIDGLDGLAGTQVLVSLAFFALVALSAGDLRLGLELLIVCGAIAGFLVFNLRSPWLKRALVFLGDTGGLLLGLAAGLVFDPPGRGGNRPAAADDGSLDSGRTAGGHGGRHVTAHASAQEPVPSRPPAPALRFAGCGFLGEPGGLPDGRDVGGVLGAGAGLRGPRGSRVSSCSAPSSAFCSFTGSCWLARRSSRGSRSRIPVVNVPDSGL